MYVYRVQHRASGLGPYHHHPNKIPDHIFDHITRWKDCPTPWADDMEGFTTAYRCGFATKRDMLAWFGFEALENLVHSCDFEIVKLDVPRTAVLVGKKQVAYDHRMVTNENTIDINLWDM